TLIGQQKINVRKKGVVDNPFILEIREFPSRVDFNGFRYVVIRYPTMSILLSGVPTTIAQLDDVSRAHEGQSDKDLRCFLSVVRARKHMCPQLFSGQPL